ncbi:MAG TPA: hypothetical protein VFZ21_31280 [Gemmatimonadaceae bacterium]|jgi:hypothetical protein|nr:hypothetical protein [Gemmatimonadaceae bacterium]
MLFRQAALDGIRDGRITLAFRRWRRPTVRTGGTLLLPIGQLHIVAVRRISDGDITEEDARRAGYASRQALWEELAGRVEGELYRVELGALGADPRIALRVQDSLSEAEMAGLRAKLAKLDASAPGGAWTRRYLELIRDNPAVRAGDLCTAVGMERLAFKANVRKLKALGLTESLEVGYRLSPRGAALLTRI